MLSADSLISGHHVFTPADEGTLTPSPTSPKKELPLATKGHGKPYWPPAGLWATLHKITSNPSLIPKGLVLDQEESSGKNPVTDGLGGPVHRIIRLPSTLKMAQRILAALLY